MPSVCARYGVSGETHSARPRPGADYLGQDVLIFEADVDLGPAGDHGIGDSERLRSEPNAAGGRRAFELEVHRRRPRRVPLADALRQRVARRGPVARRDREAHDHRQEGDGRQRDPSLCDLRRQATPPGSARASCYRSSSRSPSAGGSGCRSRRPKRTQRRRGRGCRGSRRCTVRRSAAPNFVGAVSA